MGKTAAKYLFYGVAIVLLLWTGSLTLTFVSNALPNTQWFVPVFALVVFDIGMVSWLYVFIDYAQGSGQRVIAIALCVVDLIGVGLMVVAEVFLGGQALVAAPENLGEYALWGIGIWTVLNVAGVILFHLMDPGARQRMAIQGEMDAVFEEALKKLSNKRAEQSGELSDVLADGMMTELRASMAVDRNNDGVPDVFQRGEERPAETRPTPEQPPRSDNGQRVYRDENGRERDIRP